MKTNKHSSASRLLLCSLFFLCAFPLLAQTDTLRGHWICREQGLHLYLDLGEESLLVPRYEFFGPVNGYMNGKVSDTWFLTTFKPLQHGVWTMRFSNDSGADTQEARLTINADGALAYKCVGTNYLRRSVRRKWEYLPTEMLFERVK
ncbi:MAG: hypothetical protein IKI05_00230 [Bacteroidaceae bacterium]|nr:hypothetical protein [Bacteroidaceae bacterium]